jgi:hypothetical protein
MYARRQLHWLHQRNVYLSVSFHGLRCALNGCRGDFEFISSRLSIAQDSSLH